MVQINSLEKNIKDRIDIILRKYNISYEEISVNNSDNEVVIYENDRKERMNNINNKKAINEIDVSIKEELWYEWFFEEVG